MSLLQRCVVHASRQCVSRRVAQRSRQSYCELRHRYSAGGVGGAGGDAGGDAGGRRYTERHEWVSVTGERCGTVGISQYAADSLGDVVFAQLPEAGAAYSAGEECGALESVKAASELYSPLSGTVTDKNRAVELQPALINSAPTTHGWLFKIHLDKPEELDRLMDQHQYEQFLKSDAHDKDH